MVHCKLLPTAFIVFTVISEILQKSATACLKIESQRRRFPTEFFTVTTVRYELKLGAVLLSEKNVQSEKAGEMGRIAEFVRHSRMFAIPEVA